MSSRAEDLQRLLDRSSLHELSVNYARAIDRRDRRLLLSVFHDDALCDFGPMFCGNPEEFAEWQSVAMKPYAATAHYIMNFFYNFTGKMAEGEIYFLAYHRTISTPIENLLLGGRYLDVYERRQDTWRIKGRRCVWDHFEGASAVPEHIAAYNSLSPLGAHSSDESYLRLTCFQRDPA